MFKRLLALILGKKIKGNVNRFGDKIYYAPCHRLYKDVKAEVWFKTVGEAKRKGYRKPIT